MVEVPSICTWHLITKLYIKPCILTVVVLNESQLGTAPFRCRGLWTIVPKVLKLRQQLKIWP